MSRSTALRLTNDNFFSPFRWSAHLAGSHHNFATTHHSVVARPELLQVWRKIKTLLKTFLHDFLLQLDSGET